MAVTAPAPAVRQRIYPSCCSGDPLTVVRQHLDLVRRLTVRVWRRRPGQTLTRSEGYAYVSVMVTDDTMNVLLAGLVSEEMF